MILLPITAAVLMLNQISDLWKALLQGVLGVKWRMHLVPGFWPKPC